MARHRTHHRASKGLVKRGRGASVFKPLDTTADSHGWDVGYAAIDELPDEVLLEMFDIYVNEATARTEEWHTLVHVCRRWRNVVFSSPHRLDLRLLCTIRRPVRVRLDIWPALPIILAGSVDPTTLPMESADNILTALEHRDRVCHISLQHLPNALVGRLAAAMCEPFQALTYLELRSNDESAVPGLPDTFLGGSAARLQRLRLVCIPFLALPKLLLSACQLVNLELVDIPHSGYISPRMMVTCLSALTRLDTLHLEFRSPLSRPDRTIPSPSRITRVLLPALSMLCFKGVSEYFEDLVAQIDAPLLNQIWIEYFHQLLFDTPQLLQFISRTNELKTSDRADVLFRGDCVRIVLYSRRGMVERRILGLTILCRESDWQLSSLAQLCGAFLPPLSSTLERLYIREDILRPHWHDDMENVQWLELLQPFIAVKNLYLSKGLEPLVRPVLQEVAADSEGLTGVLPALQSVVIEGVQLPGSIQAVNHGEVRRRGEIGSPRSCPPSIKTRFGIERREWSEVYD
jgi:F-box-like